MKIPLPESYSFKDDTAFVKDGILYIKKLGCFQDLMYDLTYSLNECKECYYCHKSLSRNRCTLDHLFPIDLGGPTIPNNLVFSCSKCNSTKTNLTESEFLFYLSLPKERGKEYIHDAVMQRHFVKKWYSPVVPKEWLSKEPIEKISVDVFIGDGVIGKSYKKAEKNYKKYGCLIKPIIVDRNYKLLDGFNTLLFAINNSISSISTIILENVEFVR